MPGLRVQLAVERGYAAIYRFVARLLKALLPNRAVDWLKQRMQGVRPAPSRRVHLLYAELARYKPEASFIQIGANDGILADPLRDFILNYPWRGVFVEPVPYLFERLKQNYPQRPGLAFENVAIASESGVKPFYYVRPSENEQGLPDWHIGLGSFLREVVAAHAHVIPDIEERIVTQPVECMTFTQLWERHRFENLDVLNIDTEGYDFEIIKTIDLQRCRPKILVYEQHLLSPEDYAACRELLARAGYEYLDDGMDAICLNLRDLGPEDEVLLKAWRLLKKS